MVTALVVVAGDIEVHALAEGRGADPGMQQPHHLGALLVDRRRVEIVDLDIAVRPHRMGHRPGILGVAHFAGTGDGAPPDTIAAAGPGYVVEMVNTDLAIYTKAGTKVFQQDLSQFFASVRTGNVLSDPVVVYDEQAGRFLVGVLDLSISFFGTVNGDRFLYAVSDSSNPTQDTNGDGKAFTEMHRINMTENVAAGTVFADYPGSAGTRTGTTSPSTCSPPGSSTPTTMSR